MYFNVNNIYVNLGWNVLGTGKWNGILLQFLKYGKTEGLKGVRAFSACRIRLSDSDTETLDTASVSNI